MISAKIIADSKNKFGDRITSFELLFPRIVLAEFNTHRMFSRNSASSRAIKFSKMIEMVKTNPFIPIKWMKEHTGMHGNEFFEDYDTTFCLENHWLAARDKAVRMAQVLSDEGLTKQICNRLLEPFMWHKVIVTATEYENFFALRNHPAAEIHIQELAKLMLLAYNDSTPKLLKDGEWHIPYGDDLESGLLYEYAHKIQTADIEILKVKISTSRCAGVSYTIVGEDGETENYDKLIKRHDKLSKSGHWSPFEHCAKAMTEEEYKGNAKTEYCVFPRPMDEPLSSLGWCGNFKGFIQYRKMFENENKKDSRVIKK